MPVKKRSRFSCACDSSLPEEEEVLGRGLFFACDSSLPEEEEVLGRGLFLACESNSQKRSDENQDG